MANDILETEDGPCCFFCNTSDWAYGPIMPNISIAVSFEKWLTGIFDAPEGWKRVDGGRPEWWNKLAPPVSHYDDPRCVPDHKLEREWGNFIDAVEKASGVVGLVDAFKIGR